MQWTLHLLQTIFQLRRRFVAFPGVQPDSDQEKALYIQLQQEKANATFNAWLKNLQKISEILIDRTLL